MTNNPSGENLASPVGTSGRSEVSEDDEDVTMETDPSGRCVVHCQLPFQVKCFPSASVSSKLHLEWSAFRYVSRMHDKCG